MPFFRRFDGAQHSVETAVRDHPSVEEVHVVSSHHDATLGALDWQVSEDVFFEA